MVEPPTTPPFVILIEFPSHEHFYACNQTLNEQKLCVAEYAQDECSNHGENLKSSHLILIEHLNSPLTNRLVGERKEGAGLVLGSPVLAKVRSPEWGFFAPSNL